MNKTIILNLSDVILNGDVLDVGESYGVIYNLSKNIDDEIAIDYVEGNNREILSEETYDTCTIFFYLSNIWRESSKVDLIKDICRFLKKGGNIYIWDINKEKGKMFNNRIRTILPSNNIKEFEFKNLNLISKSNLDDTKNILLDDFNIAEEKLWEDLYFIKAEKK